MKKTYRAAAALLAAILLFAALPVSAARLTYQPSAKYASSVYYQNLRDLVLTGNQRIDLVNVALSQLGYHEGNTLMDLDGSNDAGYLDYTEYGRWYGEEILGSSPFYTPWCAMFVSWCSRQAGVSEYIVNNSAYARVGTSPCYFHVPYRAAGVYLPKCGDLIFYDYSGTSTKWNHVGIVMYVKDGVVVTVEGNYNKRVIIQRHSVNDPIIRGYGTPNYSAASSEAAIIPANYTRPTGNLQKGSTGSQVAWLQAALTRLGYQTPIDGSFSAQTERALKKFQRAQGITDTGVLGKTTRNRILSLVPGGSSGTTTNPYPVPTRMLKSGSSGDDVRWLQTELVRLGLMSAVTGYFGDLTTAAVRMLQGYLGITATGNFGDQTRAGLLAMINGSGTTSGGQQSGGGQQGQQSGGGQQGQQSGSGQQNPIPDYPIPTRELKTGDMGTDVKWLQTALNRIGFTVDVTGYFGSVTEGLVKRVQKAFGLSETGRLDERTRTYVRSYLAAHPQQGGGSGGGGTSQQEPSYPVPTRDLSRGMYGDDVKWLQAALKKMGREFSVTGYFGDLTEAGVKWFQKKYGLPQTGKCDARTRTYIKAVLSRL